MSVRLMAGVFEIEISPSEKLVLLALADHARDDGTGAYPSIGRLARKTSQSRRGVQKIMRRLEDAGFIVPTGQGAGGRGLTTEYRIVLEKGERGSLFSGAKRRTVGRKRANMSAKKGERGSPESSLTVRNRKNPPPTPPAGAGGETVRIGHGGGTIEVTLHNREQKTLLRRFWTRAKVEAYVGAQIHEVVTRLKSIGLDAKDATPLAKTG